MRLATTIAAFAALGATTIAAQTPPPATGTPPGAPGVQSPPAAPTPPAPRLSPPKLPTPPPPSPPPVEKPPVDPLAGFGWFVKLAGACWKGDHPDGKTSDVQCYELQFKRFIRGSLKVLSTAEGAPKTVFEGDSVYGADPDTKGKVNYVQWGSTGNFTIGEMHVEGEMLRFQQRLAEGGESRVRFAWRRVDENSFRVSRERKDGGVWKEVFAVVYTRVK